MRLTVVAQLSVGNSVYFRWTSEIRVVACTDRDGPRTAAPEQRHHRWTGVASGALWRNVWARADAARCDRLRDLHGPFVASAARRLIEARRTEQPTRASRATATADSRQPSADSRQHAAAHATCQTNPSCALDG